MRLKKPIAFQARNQKKCDEVQRYCGIRMDCYQMVALVSSFLLKLIHVRSQMPFKGNL